MKYFLVEYKDPFVRIMLVKLFPVRCPELGVFGTDVIELSLTTFCYTPKEKTSMNPLGLKQQVAVRTYMVHFESS